MSNRYFLFMKLYCKMFLHPWCPLLERVKQEICDLHHLIIHSGVAREGKSCAKFTVHNYSLISVEISLDFQMTQLPNAKRAWVILEWHSHICNRPDHSVCFNRSVCRWLSQGPGLTGKDWS